MFEQRTNSIEDTIRQLMLDRAWLDRGTRLGSSDSLLDHGVIDSLTMMELISFLESTYGIQVTDDELVPENFDSLAAIAGFVESKQHQ